MIKTYNKQNTTGTFYKTYPVLSEERHFASTFKQLDTNACILETLQLQSQNLLNKLSQKIVVDEAKIESNYKHLNELNKDIEQHHQSSSNDKEIDLIIKSQKETIRQLFNQDKTQLANLNNRYRQQLKTLSDTFDFKEKEIQYEREERDEGWSQLIDTFQKEIVETQKQLKNIRNKEEQGFEQSSLDIYNLEEQFQNKIVLQNATRKQEHQTIIKLVSECIENMRYIY